MSVLELTGRALSRSNALLALEAAYTNKSLNSEVEAKDSPIPVHAVNDGQSFQGLLNKIAHSSRDKLSLQLNDAFLTKSIFVDNTAKQVAASSSKVREKRNSKCIQSVTMSNRRLRRLNICQPNDFPSLQAIQLLQTNWSIYLNNVMSSCQNDFQLQTRLQSVELIGAHVSVIDCQVKKQLGLCGVISSATDKCYYIVSAVSRKRKSYHDHNDSCDYFNRLHRVLRKSCVLAVFIPTVCEPQSTNTITNKLSFNETVDKDKDKGDRILDPKSTEFRSNIIPFHFGEPAKTSESLVSTAFVNQSFGKSYIQRSFLIHGDLYLPHCKGLK